MTGKIPVLPKHDDLPLTISRQIQLITTSTAIRQSVISLFLSPCRCRALFFCPVPTGTSPQLTAATPGALQIEARESRETWSPGSPKFRPSAQNSHCKYYDLIIIHLVIAPAHGLHCKHHTRMTMNKFHFNEHKQD